MRPRQLSSPADTVPILDEAVRSQALAVVSAQVNRSWQNFKARFLERDPRRRFFVLDYQPSFNAQSPVLLSPGQCVGVSLRHHNTKILFATVVEARGHFVLDDRRTIAAIRYRWPESLTELQRRAYCRTPVPAGLNLPVSMWPGGLAARSAAQAGQCRVAHGSLLDISCGGALVRLNQPTTPEWPEDEFLGLEMQLGDGKPPLALEGRSRGIRHDLAGQLCLAVQFVGLEATVDGGLSLARLAGSVQRFHWSGNAPGQRPRDPRHQV